MSQLSLHNTPQHNVALLGPLTLRLKTPQHNVALTNQETIRKCH